VGLPACRPAGGGVVVLSRRVVHYGGVLLKRPPGAARIFLGEETRPTDMVQAVIRRPPCAIFAPGRPKAEKAGRGGLAALLCQPIITHKGRRRENKQKSDVPTYLPFFESLENIVWCFWAPHAEKRPKTRLKKGDGKRRQEKKSSTFSAKSF
jgi:hypothetical protein